MLLLELLKLLLSDPIKFVIAIVILFVPLLISITVHEWAHGFTAYKFGDPTPKNQGRLTLNPFSHLDPVGTLMLFIIGIGWAKPVEINPGNIEQPYKKFKLMMVALAGPLSNFTLGVFFTFVLYFLIGNVFFESLLSWLVIINFALGMFNLIPLPPLDGANVIANLLPDNLARTYFKLAPFSLPILFLLILTGAIRYIFDFAYIIQQELLKLIASIL